MSFESRIGKLKSAIVSYPSFREKDVEVVDSFQRFLASRGTLTSGQQEYLSALEKQYSPASLKEALDWEKSYDLDKQLKASRMADYYRGTPYFQLIRNKVDTNQKLTLVEWRKLCENKYALKVLSQYDSAPLYNVGQIVEIRKRNKLHLVNELVQFRTRGSGLAAVVAVDSKPITRHAKGSRVYQILPFGSATSLHAHESDIKKARQKWQK